MNSLKIVELLFDKDSGTFSLILNTWVLILVFGLFFFLRFLIKKYRGKNVTSKIVPVKLKYKIGGAEIEYAIVRNYQNIEIAHKIYIELITRKAAIEFDKEEDVIAQIYNSWYSLFQITRDELKGIPGELLLEGNSTESLIKLLSDILNEGLRPHLTTYQAKFRKWYDEEVTKPENNGLSPQEIQSKYPDYDLLVGSMIEVNKLLIEYTAQLKKVIGG